MVGAVYKCNVMVQQENSRESKAHRVLYCTQYVPCLMAIKLSPYPLPNQIHIAVYKVDNAVVVFCVWLHTPRLCTTQSFFKSTSTVSMRLFPMVADNISEFSLR